METGAITSYIDVAQVTLYAFWIFFAGLIFYLRREDRREGYPLEPDLPAHSRRGNFNFLFIPPPKTFRLPHGGTYQAPTGQPDDREVHARRFAPWPGAPLLPTGDPMRDAIGPAAYATRRDEPELTIDGLPLIAPLRVMPDAVVDARDPDPRGMEVVGMDGLVAGTVTDLWVDRSEPQIRYLEVGLGGPEAIRQVLVPMTLARVSGKGRRVVVKSILARQFAAVPGLKNPDQVTKLEEDKITAYFAGGHLYATPARLGPVL
jgi:photosynthetic reaction center H subunit